VAAILGVVNDAPVAIDVPPVNAVYQLIVPALAVAPNATVPVAQRLAGVLAVMVGTAFTVITDAALVAVGVEIHVAFDVNNTEMLSLVTKVADINVGEFVPTFTPFLLHW
jgi:hypothetical protein